MSAFLGVLLSLTALAGWGIGDFLIQRTTRLVGCAKALFFIGLVGFLILSPFVVPTLHSLSLSQLLLLGTLSFVVIFGAVFDFEALRQGKMAVVEPVVGLELAVTVVVSVGFLGEHFGLLQFFAILLVIIGTVFVVMRRFHHSSLKLLEKGVWLAFVAALGTGLTSVLVGVASQDISPLVSIWFSHGALALVSFSVIVYEGRVKSILSDIRKHPATIGAHSIADNFAWIAFAGATTFIPISIANTISGGYIALAVLLGIVINKEKIRPHQKLGIMMVSIGVLALSYFYG